MDRTLLAEQIVHRSHFTQQSEAMCTDKVNPYQDSNQASNARKPLVPNEQRNVGGVDTQIPVNTDVPTPVASNDGNLLVAGTYFSTGVKQ
jgi:ribosomal protein S7